MDATPSACLTTSNLSVMAGKKMVFVFPRSLPVGTINTTLANLVPLPTAPSDLCYHVTYEPKGWENVKVVIIPNHQEGIDCHCIYFRMP